MKLIKNFRLSIKSAIISLFMFVITAIVLIVLYIQYAYVQRLAYENINKEFDISSANVKEQVKNIIRTNYLLTDIFTTFFSLKTNQEIINNEESTINLLIELLNQHPNLYSAHITIDNYFINVIKQINTSKNHGSYYTLVKIKNDKKETFLIDKNNNITKTNETISNFDPKKRPWFELAIKSQGIVRTKPYIFDSIEKEGITIAKKIKANAILAVDILKEDRKKLLNEIVTQKYIMAFIVSKGNDIIARANVNDELIQKILMLDLNKNETVITIDDVEYFFNKTKIIDETLIAIVDIDEVTKNFIKNFYLVIFLVIVLIVVLLPMIWHLILIIVKPIANLIEENKKIKLRNFAELTPIKTNIIEIQDLSNSMIDMAQSIQYYQQNLETLVQERTKELQEANAKLLILSVTDKLTKTYNRNQIDVILEKEVESAKRYNLDLSVIIIDIDHFKQVNDTYGHQVGDSVLVEFAEILLQNTRKSDTVGRFGGEEFIIIAPNTDKNNATKLALLLKDKISSHNFNHVGNKTASFGVASFSKETATVKEIVKSADEALYEAKNSGRNKVKTA